MTMTFQNLNMPPSIVNGRPPSNNHSGASVKGGQGGGQLPPHFLADQLTLFKPGGQIMPLTLQLAPPLKKATDAPGMS